MKVRWAGASLRLRITPTELADILLGHPVRAVLAMPGGTTWSVTLRPGAERTTFQSSGCEAAITLAERDLEALAGGETEGVYFWSDGEPRIRYYVEKDFPCAHPHPIEALEPETERFAPTEGYLRRKGGEPAGMR